MSSDKWSRSSGEGGVRGVFMKTWCVRTTAVVLWGFLGQAGLAGDDPQPGTLLIYYGFPSSINATFTVPLAAAEFARYDHVVLGNGIQDGPLDPVPHPDHQNTRDIIAHPSNANTLFYGYIDLGVSTQNLAMSEIERRVDAWNSMGVGGIFLDDFGYDFGVTRDRQNQAVDYIHAQGLPVIANGFFVDDVFGNAFHPNNPSGLPTSLDERDIYLFESHQIIRGCIMSRDHWLAKADTLQNYRDAIGFRVFSITTNNGDNEFTASTFHYAWYSAALFNHDATGWGEHLFSASGVSNSLAPFRERPASDLGAAWISDARSAGPAIIRRTNTGTLFVDTDAHMAGFLAGSLDSDGDGVDDLFDACPDNGEPDEITGDGRPLSDLDGDCDADLIDFARFQRGFSSR